MNMLYILGAERYPEQVIIQRINLDENKYLEPRVFKGRFYETANRAIKYILERMPDKVIYDEFGDGKILKHFVENDIDRYYKHYTEQRKLEEETLKYRPNTYF
ncbi:hypothetical protein EBB07_28330 [Paenibacillaceae bacterium]|nr:hypothetical protein EBB07_28330 [Paenibacillaceae bacterium]